MAGQHSLSEFPDLQLADVIGQLTSDWFAEQQAFYDEPGQLVAALKGRRAGGTRGGCSWPQHMNAARGSESKLEL